MAVLLSQQPYVNDTSTVHRLPAQRANTPSQLESSVQAVNTKYMATPQESVSAAGVLKANGALRGHFLIGDKPQN
jgi:hypothetical protein